MIQKKITKRAMATILALAMVLSMYIPIGSGFVYAAGDDVITATGGDAYIQSEVDDQTDVDIQSDFDKQSDDLEQGIVESPLSVNFAVIEEASISTPSGDKYAVIDMGDGSTQIESAYVEVLNETTGSTYTFDADTIDGSSLVFYMNYPDKSYSGDYKIKDVVYHADGTDYILYLSDSSMAPKFSVNKELKTEPDAWLVDENDTTNGGVQELTDNVNGTVDLSDGFNNANAIGIEGTNSDLEISDGDSASVDTDTEVAAADMADDDIVVSESSKLVGAINNKISNTSTSGKVVIVLDPGHGAGDSGAVRAWGSVTYVERDINQKIANACKAELEKDSRIAVYMTRTSSTEPLHGTVGEDLAWRSKFAYEKGADLFVSLHINSTGVDATDVHGTEIYIPNANYKSQTNKVSQAVGNKILTRLMALGLTGRGLFIRNSQNGTKYPDGSLSDYYAVIRGCKLYGIPGMIVEHTFVNNQNDCLKYFGSDRSIAALGVADAKGILDNVTFLQGNRANSKNVGWKTVNGHKVYYDSNEKVKTGWFKVGGKKYYADSNGYITIGWIKISGKFYYFTKAGELKIGWLTTKGKKYFLTSDGSAATGWYEVGGKEYFFTQRGYLAVGWANDGGDTYYFNANNKPFKGWHTIDGARYFFKKSGIMKKGWLTKSGNKYYFGADGKMYKGMRVIRGNRYYFTKKGVMKKGWLTFKKRRYYLNPENGRCYVNAWFKTPKGKYYYFDSKGRALVGFRNINGKRYYFNSKGMLKKGWFTVDGSKYFGKKKTGLYRNKWYESKGKTYYFDNECKMSVGFKKINGKTYYFMSNGNLCRKSIKVDGVTYNIGPDGVVSNRVLTPIMGTTTKTVEQMVARFNKSGVKYPAAALKKGGAADITTFCKIIVEESNAEGVRAEVLYSQIMIETGWLQFGGDVKISQYNFGGLGATGGGVTGAKFKNVRTGIRAQVQHLKAYASKEALKNKCVDERFKYVERGCAIYVEYLGQKENPSKKGWATAANYGYNILNLMDTL